MKCYVCGHEDEIYAFLDEYRRIVNLRKDLQEEVEDKGDGGIACPKCKWVLK